MDCNYEKLIDKLLDGNLNDDKLMQLKKHAAECDQCSKKLTQVELTDKIIRNQLSNVPYISSKDKIMERIHINEFRVHTLSLLYKSRRYILTAAAVLVIIVSIHAVRPFINFRNSAVQDNVVTPANTNKDTYNNDYNNIQNDFSPMDIRKLKFTLPSGWSVEDIIADSAEFYENGVDNGGAIILYNNYYYKGEEIIRNITPNHSELLWTEDISVPLGKGKFAAFKITSPAAAKVQTVEFEIAAVIPISDQQAYEIWIETKDAGTGSKKLFMDIINNIRY